MKDILNYLQENHIDFTYASASVLDYRIEMKVYDCDISAPVDSKTTLSEFLKDCNDQYLSHLKRRLEFYESMAIGTKSQIDNFKPIFKQNKYR